MNNQPHEWTESGRELLRNVEELIKNNGGRYRMLCKVQREANNRIYRFKKSNSPISVSVYSVIFNNWNKLTLPEISRLVNLPQGTVYWRGRWLGLPTKGTSLYQNNRKIVLNTEIGVYYDSVLEASNSVGSCYKTLSRKLKGDCNNNTSFKRV